MPSPNRPVPPACYLGIDPGLSGGLACLSLDPPDLEPVGGKTLRDLWDWFRHFEGRPVNHVFAFMEKVGGFVKTNGPQPGSAMFRFGQVAGQLEAFLVAARVPYELVTPQRWQSGLGIPPRKKGESKGAFKNRLKQQAQRLFPDVHITLATCDALLIAEYGRRKREGRL